VTATDGAVFTVDAVKVSGSTVTLMLPMDTSEMDKPTIRTGQKIMVVYDEGGTGNPVQDDDPGNDAAGFTLGPGPDEAVSVVNGSMVDATAPGKPTGLAAEGAGRDPGHPMEERYRIDLSWMAPADTGGSPITGYRIEWSADASAGSWDDLEADTGETTGETCAGAAPENGVAYCDTGLEPDTTRHYRVSAINAEGTGAASDAADVTTPRGTPGAPTDFSATAVAPGSNPMKTAIKLAWTAPTDLGTPPSAILRYELEWSEDGDAPWKTVADDIAAAASAIRRIQLHDFNILFRGMSSAGTALGTCFGAVLRAALGDPVGPWGPWNPVLR